MPLAAGTRLGPYEILAPLGAGGMGEVYRSRDTRLDRTVAIKVLPAHLADRAELRERFEREARAVSSLNHPHICTLYDVGSQDGTHFLVMEYLDGETLADRLERGPLPLDQALKCAIEIADALDKAHRQGVVHRDLKPGNVMITKSGSKLLDFGLARLRQPANTPAFTSDSVLATNKSGLTTQGTILGTLQYMAPEQLEGKDADARTDIFAFGALVYEMVTGRRAFEGKSQVGLIAAILEREPAAITTLQPTTPPELDRVIQRCLAKDPDDRWQTAADLAVQLTWLAGVAPSAVAASSKSVSAARSSRAWMALSGLLFIAALGLAFATWTLWPKQELLKSMVRLEVDLGSDVSFSATSPPEAVLSRDGSRIAYISQRRLFTRRFDQAKAVELPGTEGATGPFFSPDGQWVGFFGRSQLKKIPVNGGGAVVISDGSGFDQRGASWADDGTIVAALASGVGLSRIPASGGAPIPLTRLVSGEVTHRWPQVLPGGKAVLFSSSATRSGLDETSIKVASLPDGHAKTIMQGGTFARYLSAGKHGGYLIFVNRGTLFSVPFDLEKLEVRGTPEPILEDVVYSSFNGSAQLDFSQNGILIYRSGSGSGLSTFQWLDASGKTEPLLAKPGVYQQARVSPDGERLALTVAEGPNTDVWVYNPKRDILTRLTFGGSHGYPVWTPDGRFVLFTGNSTGFQWAPADGSAQPQPLNSNPARGDLLFSFTPDGNRLSFQEYEAGKSQRYDIWTVPFEIDGSGPKIGKPEPFLQTPFDERHPVFSPDGRWLAYTSDDSGEFQIYVTPFPSKSGKWQISSNGGLYPQWSQNGRELFFRTLDNKIMAVHYTVNGNSFVAEKPLQWSQVQLSDLTGPNYSVAPDGKRIAALVPADSGGTQSPPSHVTFLFNFLDELRRRTPLVK